MIFSSTIAVNLKKDLAYYMSQCYDNLLLLLCLFHLNNNAKALYAFLVLVPWLAFQTSLDDHFANLEKDEAAGI
jgi:uncharacterized membrane protein YfhO